MKTPNILIVDDHQNQLDVLSSMIQHFIGSNIYLVKSVEKATQIFDEHDLDLIILDMKLPKQNGFVFLDIVIGQGSDIPVICISADMDKDAMAKSCMDGGAYATLTKPIKLADLGNVLKKALNL